ncbi:MAG TPA: DUF885 domain-containing protein [Opitutaceae bacterium]|jgi:uncharacterized protein (DUF885 family)|nr:DUF885 domain-containing protein [Opitutaceae bacterium]
MTSADAAFAALARDYVETTFRANPERATAFGDHRYDGQLRDYSPSALDAERRDLRATLARLAALDPRTLTDPNPADAEILRNAIDDALFELEEERPFATNPLSYDVSLAQGIYLLFAREVLPPRERLRGIAGRLAQIPRVVAQARANLERPPRVHTETAIQRCPGTIGLIRTDIEPLIAQVPELRAELEPLQAQAIAALESYLAWLEKDLLPRSDGDFRLGEARFRRKLRFALFSDLTPEEIRSRAERELESATAELHQTALAYGRSHGLAAPAASPDRSAVIRAALAHVSERHASDSTLVPRCQEILSAATDFVRRHDLVTLPDAPVSVILAPVFVRGVSVAYCDPPGALEPSGNTFFAIAPAPESWTPERKRSYYREYCDAMLHDLTVHEAMPGHYVQLARANRFHAPTPIRALFYSGTFVEGWAIWSEKLMAGLGFGGPENKLQQLKMRLRMVINALLDQGIHMGGMTEKEAMDLMLRRGFQEEAEAAGKWRRACLTSTQLSTYFVGATEFEDLRCAAQKAWGPAFTDKRFHDTVTAFGSPPCRLVRQAMGI